MGEYNNSFFKKMAHGAESSANLVLPILFSLIKPKSVLDLGCGIGCWLKVSKELGATTIFGFDGSYVNPDQLLIDASEFNPIDLSMSMPMNVKVDLAICLEVAEHLPEARSDAIVLSLCTSSDVVLFGAAIPKQGGAHHINEQWQSYWINKFDKLGFVPSTRIRNAIWNDSRIALWYRQNSLIFIKKDRSDILNIFGNSQSQEIYDLVHPDLYSLKMRRYSFIEILLTFLQKMLNIFRSLIK
jgi:hypothetical protein